MKAKKLFFMLFAVLVCACLLMTGCTQAMPKDSGMNGAEIPMPSVNKPQSNFDSDGEPGEIGSDTGTVLPVGRKIIRNAELTVQTVEFERFMSSMLARLNALGGYVERNSVDNHTYGGRLRYASCVVRVPAEKLDEFLSEIDGLGNIIHREEDLADVTDHYTDTEAKLAALRTEYDTLLGLLSNAEKLEDIITLQDRLSDVRYQIESLEARIRTLDSQIAYSTVTMTVNEVLRETAVEPETFGEEVSRRFNESLEDVGSAFSSFAKWLIGNLPHIVMALFFFALPVVIVLIIVKSHKRRKARLLRGENSAASQNAAPAVSVKTDGTSCDNSTESDAGNN